MIYLLQKDNEEAGSSDSDYGDWGTDDWGFDEQKTTKKVGITIYITFHPTVICHLSICPPIYLCIRRTSAYLVLSLTPIIWSHHHYFSLALHV